MPAKTFVKKRIVCIGGGTGTSAVINALKGKADLCAVLAMFDNGGSAGQIKKELGLLPMGDLRQCLIAFAENRDLASFLKYRFEKGFLKGHNLGNIILAAGAEKDGYEKTLEGWGKILGAKGKVIPATLDKAELEAVLQNKKTVKGEEEIVNCPEISGKLEKLQLSAKAKANPKAIIAIKKADFIIIGPGKFYTSIMPIFLTEGIAGAVQKSKAKKIFICNLMTQPGNTDNFTVEKFLTETEKFLGKEGIIDKIIFNTKILPKETLKTVLKNFPGAGFVGYEPSIFKDRKFIGADLLSEEIQKLNPADMLVKGMNQRTIVIHSQKKLAKVLQKILKSNIPS
ncbi:MAG: YvcK family protein [Candidatus Pacebacteria bacterium]|nr:YvcK family protein [Candidatus Paceibacterota bacterium]